MTTTRTRILEHNVRSAPVDVHFTPAQLQYLTGLFPNVVLNASATEADMRHYFGQQAVIRAVRLRTRGLNASSDIPTTTT